MAKTAKVTAADVARKCGVSVTTVYEILGKLGHRYREETRAEVLAAATSLGFRPNAAARAMASGRFGMIGVVANAGGRTLTLRSDLLSGIEEEAARHHSSVAFARIEQNHQDGAESRLLGEDLVDGVILLPDLSLDQLRRVDVRVPLVYANYKMDTDCVYPDEIGAARRVTERLLASGVKNVVYADFGRSPHFSAVDRRDGYGMAMLAAGLQPQMHLAPPLGPHEDWFAHARSWLTSLKPPIGLVTYAVSTAVPILRAAMTLGWTLPNDLRCFTFGGSEVPDYRYLPLAAAYIPQRELGIAAMRMLATRIACAGAPQPAVCVPYDPVWDMVPPELIQVLGVV